MDEDRKGIYLRDRTLRRFDQDGEEFSFPWSDFYQEIAANALCKRNEESQKSILAEDITDCITNR